MSNTKAEKTILLGCYPHSLKNPHITIGAPLFVLKIKTENHQNIFSQMSTAFNEDKALFINCTQDGETDTLILNGAVMLPESMVTITKNDDGIATATLQGQDNQIPLIDWS